MLVIKNIEKLKHTTIGAWRVNDIEVDYVQPNISTVKNYVIRLTRNGKGAAIVIDRIYKYGYDVWVCYENYDKILELNKWSKQFMQTKKPFLVHMQLVLDSEYNKIK
jgi:hypothetical protein